MLTDAQKPRALEIVDQIEILSRQGESFKRLVGELIQVMEIDEHALAAAIGVSYYTIYRWAKDANPPRADSLTRLRTFIETGQMAETICFTEAQSIPRPFLEALLEQEEPKIWMLGSLFEAEKLVAHYHITLTKEQAAEVIKSANK